MAEASRREGVLAVAYPSPSETLREREPQGRTASRKASTIN
ncbi:MAG: hypothetical protein RMY28_021210 [Nostoc sp. ChiSLP01]